MLGTVFMPLLVSFHQARKRAMQAQGQAAGRVRAEHSELVLPQDQEIYINGITQYVLFFFF